MNKLYKQQVSLLIRIVPLVYPIKEFAVHGGTAINLFVRNMPRYSVDLDITYLPIKEREESIADINRILLELKTSIEKAIPGIRVVHKPAVWKLLCTKDGATVKIEVNGTKRGIIGDVEDKEFLLSFERGEPDWSRCCAGDLSNFPSVRWKLQNILKLKKSNPRKFDEGIEKLSKHLDTPQMD